MHLNIDYSHLQLRRWLATKLLYAMFSAGLAIGSLGYVTASAAAAVLPATVTEQDNGKTIEVAIGQKILVQLPSNPTTGYRWSVLGSPAPLVFVKSDYTTDPQAAGRAGAGGTQTLQFTSRSPGKVELKLGYGRSWEKEVAPAKTFSVIIVVK